MGWNAIGGEYQNDWRRLGERGDILESRPVNPVCYNPHPRGSRREHFSVIARVIVVVLGLALAGWIVYKLIYPNLRRR